jgi:hypothetical protein
VVRETLMPEAIRRTADGEANEGANGAAKKRMPNK